MISGLPILDLILLVAVQRLAQRGKLDVNFEMVRNTAFRMVSCLLQCGL